MAQSKGPALLGAVCCALGGSGCWADTPEGTVGEMGYGVFQYHCVDQGDAVCNETDTVDWEAVAPELGINHEVPAAVAVGARFDLTYVGHVPAEDGRILPIEVVPARPGVVSTLGGFAFTEPGTVALLAHSPQGYVADFVHLTAAQATSLELWRGRQRISSMLLGEPAEEAIVAVVPSAGQGVSLAGALSYAWSSSNHDVLRVGQVGSSGTPPVGAVVGDDEVRLVAVGAGDAVLEVAHDDLVEQLMVTVGPEATP